jgi:hypothetical protein
MTVRDSQDLPMSGADGDAAGHYGRALQLLLAMRTEAVAEGTALVETHPGMPMAHLFAGSIALTAAETAAEPVLRQALTAARALERGATLRERMHMAAHAAWLLRDFMGAARLYDEIRRNFPHDLLAQMVGHQVDFFCGRAAALRDHPAEALKLCPTGTPGRGYLLGMLAFGLEENGAYAEAEAAGEAAVAIGADDVWAIHAVAHCHEMTGNRTAGIRWLEMMEPEWGGDNFLSCHNSWHLALFHLADGDPRHALALYDARIAREPGASALDLVDGSAMLWRLHLAGIDVSGRARVQADCWEHALGTGGGTGHYVWNDLHAAMARVMAGQDEARWHLAALRTRAAGGASHDRVIGAVGLPLVEAIYAFGAGHYDRAAELLAAHGPRAIETGGSNAQRDVLRQTLEAALTRSRRRAA